MVQFQKDMPTGELEALRAFDECTPYSFKVIRPKAVPGFIWELDEAQKLELRDDMLAAVRQILQIMKDGSCDVLILDEILGVLKNKLLTERELLDLIASRPANMELILTGREAPETIRSAADYVSLIQAIRHPYEKGVKGRKGIEF
jgi:cob(I)alamin adenosyltransferase